MKMVNLRSVLATNELDEKIKLLICTDEVEEEKKRYLSLLDQAEALYGEGEYHIISAPGRTEIGGNHTDHQHGKVIAASVNIDSVALAKKSEDNIVKIKSLGFNIKPIDLSDLSVHQDEINTTESLIRGIAYRFQELGFKIGGIDALSQSKVLVGSGISSSASFEVLVAELFNQLYNDGQVDAIEIAKIAQYAENVYFGKPCGLLDQMAISCGGFTIMDFENPSAPIVEKHDFNFDKYGYHLVLTNTKGDHADLSDEYGKIPGEMKLVAKAMGHEVLRECDENEFYANFKHIRETVNNDRAMLRAIHLFNENHRVDLQAKAIKEEKIEDLLKLMKESGHSSYQYLQNVSCVIKPYSQSLGLALALSERCLKGEGAFRVHGGGFEGTIQAVVPTHLLQEYLKTMQAVYGEDATFEMNIRSLGGYQLI